MCVNYGAVVACGIRYTMLGVDFNAATGEIAFLILDPHYTGEDRVEKYVA